MSVTVSDIWVNWFEGEDNGYNVCDFFEWRKDDFIEVLDIIPVVKVKPSFFTYVEDSLGDLPEELLNMVRNRSVLNKNDQREIIEYAFIISDGDRTLAVDTLGYKIPTRKSRLIPRHDSLVLGLVTKLDTFECEIPTLDSHHEGAAYLLNPPFSIMVGLTRHERTLKQILLQALEWHEARWDFDEAYYWYKEFSNGCTIEPNNLRVINKCINDIASTGWSERHEELTRVLSKSSAYFQTLLNQEESAISKKAK